METINHPYVFQTDSTIIKEGLNQSNYLIEYTDHKLSKEKYCIIYFSSHNIYYPNTEDEFKNSIVDKNKFEWYGSRIKKGSKHIFIRDIQKQWYLNGISNNINSVEKLTEFLKEETKGYKTIMMGSSGGGYASVLFGSLLNSEYIISFNGQFQLYDLLETSKESIDPIVFRERNNTKINKYYTVKDSIQSPEKVFYFYSNKSSWDTYNKNYISDLPINILSFDTGNHGIPFVKSAIERVINSNYDELLKLSNKTYNPIIFSLRLGGFTSTSKILIKKLIEKWRK
ncbi:hypothetical protein [Algibacter lectus]|uniref:hypothetical protein n=1 Tax=Algibacter lectus TaxID=221126 RepID=UPI00249529FB|nr:hypothetical protein [Algibacter lectus]